MCEENIERKSKDKGEDSLKFVSGMSVGHDMWGYEEDEDAEVEVLGVWLVMVCIGRSFCLSGLFFYSFSLQVIPPLFRKRWFFLFLELVEREKKLHVQ